MKLLVVEDEERIASFLRKGLTAEGYAVDHVRTGAEALARARDPGVDLVLLDLVLPDGHGPGIVRRLRGEGVEIPIIVLGASNDIEDRVQALELGADDYLTKPFHFEELVARVRARIRSASKNGSDVLRTGELQLDLRTRRAKLDGRVVDLTAREFMLLQEFLRHPTQVLSRERLLSRVWGLAFDPGSNLVDVYVGYLRRKLGDHCIRTVRGVGYELAPPDGQPAGVAS